MQQVTGETKAVLLHVRDALRRLDPAWCAVNDVEQITDEELDLAIGELEDLLEEAQ